MMLSLLNISTLEDMKLSANSELIDYELGQELESPVRAEFYVASQEIPELNVIIDLADDTTLELTLPYVTTLGGNHYYSLPYKLFTNINLTSQGPIGDGHTFSTKSELQTAIDDWANDSISATETYGDISTWNVSAITNMDYLFTHPDSFTSRLKEITTLDLSGWDVSNVESMKVTFGLANQLTSLNLNGWNTSNVETMRYMFYQATIPSLDLSSFDTSKVYDFHGMFQECGNLHTLNGVADFNTTSADYARIRTEIGYDKPDWRIPMSYMFRDCNKLTSLEHPKKR